MPWAYQTLCGTSTRTRAFQNIARAGALVLFVLLTPNWAHAENNYGLETQVRNFFADAPIMIDIARCESRFRQFNESGEPLYGGYAGKMVGIFQVYSDIHNAAARAMGIDIETPEGNMSYARHLYEAQGTRPWLSSSHCWGTPIAEASEELVVPAATPVATSARSAAEVTSSLTKDLKLGTIDPEVLILQKILNQNGFALGEDGLGSSGYETEKFGALTRDAVRRFQCEKGIVCKGDETTTGYGMVGARTRAALNALPLTDSAQLPSRAPTSSTVPLPESGETSASSTAADIDGSTQLFELQRTLTELFKTVTALQPQS